MLPNCLFAGVSRNQLEQRSSGYKCRLAFSISWHYAVRITSEVRVHLCCTGYIHTSVCTGITFVVKQTNGFVIRWRQESKPSHAASGNVASYHDHGIGTTFSRAPYKTRQYCTADCAWSCNRRFIKDLDLADITETRTDRYTNSSFIVFANVMKYMDKRVNKLLIHFF